MNGFAVIVFGGLWYGSQVSDVVVFCAGNDIWKGLDAQGLEELKRQMCKLKAACQENSQELFLIDVVPDSDATWDLQVR